MSAMPLAAAARIARLARIGFDAARAELARASRALAEAEAALAAHRAALASAPPPRDGAEAAAHARWLRWHAETAERLAAQCARARNGRDAARDRAAHALARARAAEFLLERARHAARRAAEARAERAALPATPRKDPLTPRP
ncbi:MAG: hypothetical protein KatS3mg118_3425 [Paracoccaceae bacterium]|nr:MAG: hypothetical protein D6686_07515 [Alphaproteobacteria bacterium]GIX15466.1 MAG: hypothetical protein KatS3mg118_3425 [Paracoccaceae bacterium]